MSRINFFLSFIIILALLLGCKDINSTKKSKVLVLQPFGDFSQQEIEKVKEQMEKIVSIVKINKSMQLPASAYYKERNRYRADSIIRFLKDRVGEDTIILGLTTKDISTTKGNHKDWGVMGLGYRPGKSCIISTFRLSKKNKSEQLYKVVAHEFGHTTGLDHCKNKTCIMRDAEGGNPLDEEKDFCERCKAHLKKKRFFN